MNSPLYNDENFLLKYYIIRLYVIHIAFIKQKVDGEFLWSRAFHYPICAVLHM
jgi:hypothetical protein